jgi:hypothetical protein
MRLYFAHNFNHRKGFREIELRLEKELGIELFNPFYDDITRTEEMNLMDNPEKTEDRNQAPHHEWCIVNHKMLVARDLKNLVKQDGLLTIIMEPSIGTTLEIANAKLMCKPIYVISEKYYDHPWILTYATHIFKTIEEFKQYIKDSRNKKPEPPKIRKGGEGGIPK